MKILIAEDNGSIAKFLELKLSLLGFESIVCADGESASHYLLNNPERPALALFDLNMPVMGGLSALRKVRSKGVFIPVIAMTSSILGEALGLGALPGFDGLLTKPFADGALREIISTHIE